MLIFKNKVHTINIFFFSNTDFRKYGQDIPEHDMAIQTKTFPSYLNLYLFFTLTGVFSFFSE